MNDLDNAPAPSVMREELVNIVMARGGGNLSRTKAGDLVDLLLVKQMSYYSQMAVSEVDMSGQEAAAIIAALPGRVEAVLRQGAAMAPQMLPHDRKKWQFSAELLRDTCRDLVELL